MSNNIYDIGIMCAGRGKKILANSKDMFYFIEHNFIEFYRTLKIICKINVP